MVAVYGVHLLLLGLIGGIWAYGGCWLPPGAIRAGWWQIGVAWHGVAYCGTWCSPGKVSTCCTRRMCWLYVK